MLAKKGSCFLNFFRVTPWNLHPTIPAFHQVSNFLKNVILKQQTLQTTFPVPLFFFWGPIIQFTGTKKNNSPLSSVRSTCTTPILFESPCYGNIWVSHIWKQSTKLPWTRVGRSPERTSTTMTNASKNPRWGTTVLPMQGKNFGENQLTYLHPGSPRPFK